MENANKEDIKLKLATCFRSILNKKKSISLKNKANDVQDIRLVDSMRQLEAESGLSYTIIQGLSVGKRDVQFTTLLILIESLGLTFSEFAKQFDNITERQIKDAVVEIENNKNVRRSKRT